MAAQASSARILSRPTTPLRPPSRTSLRASQSTPSQSLASSHNATDPLAALEPAFAELSDSMADLEANMMHLQLLHESVSRFNECFGAFLYGLEMTGFCVDFAEAPIPQSFARYPPEPQAKSQQASPYRSTTQQQQQDSDATFLTADTSFFVDNPPTEKKPRGQWTGLPPRQSSAAPGSSSSTRGRGGTASRARGGAGTGSGSGNSSGIGRGGTSTRGARGGAGVGRGAVARGRGGVVR